MKPKPKPKKLTLTHLPFVEMRKDALDFWEKAKWNGYNELLPPETVYVSVCDLKEKARRHEKYDAKDTWFSPSVWKGMPGFMSRSWVNPYKTKNEYNYRFSTGLYHNSGELLLMDDVIAWSHRQINKDKVRSAFDIIVMLQKGEIEL